VNSPIVRRLEANDWPEVEAIYREGIATGHATFESEPPPWESFDAGKRTDLRLVAVDGGRVVGWAAASATSTRSVYAGVVEHSVYVAESARGRGVGHLLLTALVESADTAGIWTIQSSVFPENRTSLALHASHGFRTVGRRERIAKMTYGPLAGQWRDTILIERRSPS
jgi:L-amino acid N-acyltransferase YncA